MIRKEGSKQSEGLEHLQIAENQNLGLPKTDRHSTFLYFSTNTSYFIDVCKMHTLYENVRRQYMNISTYKFLWSVLRDPKFYVFGSLASGLQYNR